MGRRGAKLASVAASAVCLGSILAGGPSAEGSRTPFFRAEALTITVDRAAREISGKLVADSTYWHMCWGDGDAPVKIRRVQPGRDKLVGEDPYTDFERNWKVRFRGSAVKGKRIYAEVPGFDKCESVRSRTVRAP
jgi:hypothetical protein